MASSTDYAIIVFSQFPCPHYNPASFSKFPKSNYICTVIPIGAYPWIYADFRSWCQENQQGCLLPTGDPKGDRAPEAPGAPDGLGAEVLLMRANNTLTQTVKLVGEPAHI